MARPVVTYIAPRYAASGFVNPLDPFGLLTGGLLGMAVGPQSSATTEGYGSGAGPGQTTPSTQPGAIYGAAVPGGIPNPTAPATQTAANSPNAPQTPASSNSPQGQPAPVAAPTGPTSQAPTGTSSWAVFFVLAACFGGAAVASHHYHKRGR